MLGYSSIHDEPIGTSDTNAANKYAIRTTYMHYDMNIYLRDADLKYLSNGTVTEF